MLRRNIWLGQTAPFLYIRVFCKNLEYSAIFVTIPGTRIVKIFNAVSLNSPEISDYSHKWLWYRKQEPVSYNIRPKTKVRIPFLSGHSVCRRARKVINNYKDVVNGLRTINDHFQEGKRVFGNTQQRMNKELKDSYDYIIERSKWLIWFLIWILTLLYRHGSFKKVVCHFLLQSQYTLYSE